MQCVQPISIVLFIHSQAGNKQPALVVNKQFPTGQNLIKGNCHKVTEFIPVVKKEGEKGRNENRSQMNERVRKTRTPSTRAYSKSSLSKRRRIPADLLTRGWMAHVNESTVSPLVRRLYMYIHAHFRRI